MGLNARNSYLIKTSNPESSQQQTEVVSPTATRVLTTTQTPTIEELVSFKKETIQNVANSHPSIFVPPDLIPKF